jgi:hypothetical protein
MKIFTIHFDFNKEQIIAKIQSGDASDAEVEELSDKLALISSAEATLGTDADAQTECDDVACLLAALQEAIDQEAAGEGPHQEQYISLY